MIDRSALSIAAQFADDLTDGDIDGERPDEASRCPWCATNMRGAEYRSRINSASAGMGSTVIGRHVADAEQWASALDGSFDDGRSARPLRQKAHKRGLLCKSAR